MSELLLPALFWGIPLAISLRRAGRPRAARRVLFGGILLHLLAGGVVAGPLMALAVSAAWGAAWAVLSFHDRALFRGRRVFRAGVRGASAERLRRSAVGDAARAAADEIFQKLDRIQNRFALVQTMATKLEGAEILRSLGGLWSGVPSVRRCALFQRRPNGGWAAVFAQGVENPPVWAAALGSHPTLGRLRRVRRYAAGEGDSALKALGLESPFLMVPFVWGEDVMALGLLEVDAPPGEEVFEGFIVERKLVSIGLRRAFLYDLMTERSRHDALTGAFLRRAFLERMEEALRKWYRYKVPFCLAMMDLDRFKDLNDRWGHLTGDAALVHLAQTARRLAPPGVALGRLGGDEFAFLFEGPSLEEARGWLDRFSGALRDSPLREGRETIPLSISAGLSAAPAERVSAEELLRRADEALYEAKRAGRGRVVLSGAGERS